VVKSLVECPSCGKDNTKPASTWVGGKGTKSPMAVRRFVCSSCGTSYVAWLDAKTLEMKTMTKKRRG